MYKVNTLGLESKQQFTMQLDGNTRIVFDFEYKANQLGWFFGFEYNDEKYQNIRLTTSPNILRAYKSWLPFGVMCTTEDGLEPMDLEDFVSGYASIYILTSDDINAVEGKYYDKVPQEL